MKIDPPAPSMLQSIASARTNPRGDAPAPRVGATPGPTLRSVTVDRIVPSASASPNPTRSCPSGSSDAYPVALGVGLVGLALAPVVAEVGAAEIATVATGAVVRAASGVGRATVTAAQHVVGKAFETKTAFSTAEGAGKLIGEHIWKTATGMAGGWTLGAGAAAGAWAAHKALDFVDHASHSSPAAVPATPAQRPHPSPAIGPRLPQ